MTRVLMAMFTVGMTFAAGCGSSEDWQQQEFAQESREAQPTLEPMAEPLLVSCTSGYHARRIAVSSTVVSTDGACGGGRTLHRGDYFCEKNSQIPVWCSRLFEYERFGYAYNNHEYIYVRSSAF